MKRNKTHWWMAFGLMMVIALVACGATGAKNKTAETGKTSRAQSEKTAPLTPLTYDPRISLAPLVERLGAAVVNIQITQKVRMRGGMPGGNLFEFFFGPQGQEGGPFGRPAERQRQSMGSGFIIDASGLVVTNHHVVKDADEIEVKLHDSRTFSAKLVGSDERTDVALLKLDKASGLPTVTFGSSADMRVGDRVVAIGNPFGLDHTVTEGIISAKERIIGAGPYDDFIQTDASINPGNSGGPLFNLKGEVIGINTAITRTGQGIGFAIPSDLASSVIASIQSSGKVTRGWLGVTFQPMDADLARALGAPNADGALVSEIVADSPAQKGGVQVRDIIVGVAGKKVKNASELPARVAVLKPGQKVVFDLLRNGKPAKVTVEIGEMADDGEGVSGAGKGKGAGKDAEAAKQLGIEVVPLDDNLKRRLQADAVKSGVVVSAVKPDGPAARGLREGDIIVEVNREAVTDVASFHKRLSDLRKGDDVLLQIYRRGTWRFLVIRL